MAKQLQAHLEQAAREYSMHQQKPCLGDTRDAPQPRQRAEGEGDKEEEEEDENGDDALLFNSWGFTGGTALKAAKRRQSSSSFEDTNESGPAAAEEAVAPVEPSSSVERRPRKSSAQGAGEERSPRTPLMENTNSNT